MTSSCSSSSASESFELVKPFDFFANNNTDDSENDGTNGTSIEVLDADGNRPEDSLLTGDLSGLRWIGDVDNEYIWGTSWEDTLVGGSGNDVLYGFESNDVIQG